jgi:hypothetical protein
MSDSSHTVWGLQRVALLRARTVIFSGIHDLGGSPTENEEARQVAEDARMAERMTAELRETLAAAGVASVLASAFPASQRDYWSARVPALLSFGARTHSELVRLAPRAIDDAKATSAAGIFQLAASLLDWIGDEDGSGTDVIRWLPTSTLDCIVRDPAAKWALMGRLRRDARPSTAAFVALLGLLIDLVHELPGDTDRFFEQLSVAYGAELASFRPLSSVEENLAVARLKSEAPTAVVGELARLVTMGDPNDIVGRAVSPISGIFGTIDDLADLSADLRTGDVNTLVAAADLCDNARDDVSIARALRAVLATDVIEERSVEVADRVHDLARMLDDANVDAAASAAALEWLRVTTWRWIA